MGRPILRLEMRAPAGIGAAGLTEVEGELSTDRNRADVVLEKQAEPLARSGYVPLYFRTSQRLLVFKSPDGHVRLYNLRLPADPMGKKYHDWSSWQKPDFVDERGSNGPRRAGKGDDIEIRYRVETAEE